MVRAATCGALDFALADPRDRRWWEKVRIVLDELERREDVESARDHLAGLAAILSRDNLEDRSYTSLRDTHRSVLAGVDRRRFPWQAISAESVTSAAESLRAQWVEAWGDPESPETKAKIEATVEALRRVRVRPRE